MGLLAGLAKHPCTATSLAPKVSQLLATPAYFSVSTGISFVIDDQPVLPAAEAADQTDAGEAQLKEEDSAEDDDLGADANAAEGLEGLSEDEAEFSDKKGGLTEELNDDMGLFGEHAVARQRGARWALQPASGLPGWQSWRCHAAAAHVTMQRHISAGRTSRRCTAAEEPWQRQQCEEDADLLY